ncbi:MAG: AraC family transcriptional regulator [Lachnospiraceae bacterium]|nr:AraC family transcriptional regulator [Lachnospiraceae bacterium]
MPKNEKALLYSTNSDFKGTIEYIEGNHEVVDFHDNSSVRIWCNMEAVGYKPHWHEALEILLPVENYYEVVIHDETVRINPGEIFVIPPGCMHEIKNPPAGGTRFIYLFDMTVLNQMKGFAGLQPALISPIHATKSSYPRIFDEAYNTLIRMRNLYFYGGAYSELAVYSLFMSFLILFGENHDTDEKLFSNTKPHKQQQYVKEFNRLLEYINDNYMQPITLEDAAESIGFSKYYFSRLFKQYTDYTFCDYLTLRRIRAAKELLSDPEYSIMDIAMNTGFSSISTFNRVFKDSEGCTPSAFRAKRSIHV